MIESHIRSKAQPFLDNLGKTYCVAYNISPNTITLCAFLSGIASAVLISNHCLLSALFLLLFSGLCDIMDGTVARITQQSRKIGAYLDLISDRMVEAAVIFGFAIVYPQHYLAYIVFLIALLLHFSTFIVAGALFPNAGEKSIHYDRSIVERSEAFVVFALMMLFPSHIFIFLSCFNMLVIGAGITRFFRVLSYANHIDSSSNSV